MTIYLDDIPEVSTCTSSRVTVTEAHIVAFAGLIVSRGVV